MNRLIFTLALVALALPVVAMDDGGVPGGYMRYGASARSLALGNAVTGLADDVTTSYWNPAGYAQLRTMELSAMGANLGFDTKYGFVALGLPTASWGTFALSGTYTNSGDFERTTVYEDLNETFSETEGVFSLGWGKAMGRLSVGMALKTVRQDIGGAAGSGTGVDLGAYYRPHRSLAIGVAVQNAVAPKIKLVEEEETINRSLRAGLAVSFFQNRLHMTSDVVRTEWMDTSYRAGLEIWPARMIAVRGGYDGEKEQWSAGAGLRLQNWQFDYAFVDTDLGSQNIVSATLRFGVPYGVKLDSDRALFSPSGADRSVTFGIRTAVRGEVDSWQVIIADDQGREVRRLEGAGSPPDDVTWDGADTDGRLVGDGTYTASVLIIDELGQIWDYEADVEVLGFRERTRNPIRLEIGGTGAATNGSDQ